MSQKLKLSDLLKDDSFVQWLKEGQPVDNRQWHSWYVKDPSHDTLVNNAREILQGIPFREKFIPQSESKEGWEKIISQIQKEITSSFSVQSNLALKIAASVCLIIVAGAAILWHIQRTQWATFQTTYGETKAIVLPDSSKVILGANSKLKYNMRSLEKEERKLELIGQAYFKVKHVGNDIPFTVQVKDLYIEALGTSFNINDYTDKTIVSLLEGRLRLRKEFSDTTNNIGREPINIILKPQQTVWFDESQQKFLLSSKQTAYWTSWIEKKWFFGSGTPLSKVLAKIEAVYGLDCMVLNQSLLKKELAGEVSIESPQILFESIAVLLNIEITQQGKQLIFKYHTE